MKIKQLVRDAINSSGRDLLLGILVFLASTLILLAVIMMNGGL
jgi:hypothetical protein